MVLSLPPVPGTGPVVLAFSGGLDSTVLLHLLAADPGVRGRGLKALHVDHGLHPEAGQWASTCADACSTLGVAFEARRVQVLDTGQGPEAAARAARYRALLEGQRPDGLIALAHHQDDQAETLLLRLLRGSGDGLAGMRALRPFGPGWLWRPLLAVPRARLLAFAQDRGLRWIEDPSNADDRFDRNFLRHRILPVLAERWPQPAAALARSAGLLATQATLLADEDTRRLARIQGLDPATLQLPALMAQPPAWRDRLLRAWVHGLGLPPLPASALPALAQQVLPARADAVAEFAWSGAAIRRWRDLLHAGLAQLPLPADWSTAWTGQAPLPLPTGDTLQLQPALAFDEPVTVRARQGGERLVLPGREHHSPLKHVLQDLGVPPWQRARLPLVFAADGELLAAGDVALSARLQSWLDRHQARLRLSGGDPADGVHRH